MALSKTLKAVADLLIAAFLNGGAVSVEQTKGGFNILSSGPVDRFGGQVMCSVEIGKEFVLRPEIDCHVSSLILENATLFLNGAECGEQQDGKFIFLPCDIVTIQASAPSQSVEPKID